MALLEGLSWAKFMEVSSESETTEGKYGIPRYDGNVHQLQEYTYRVKLRELKESSMEPAELKKIGPLGIRLVEGLRGPALHMVREIPPEELAGAKGPSAVIKCLTRALRPRREQEARELYKAGAKEHGPLSRQYGEPVSMFVLRRRTWWSMLQDLDSNIKLPEEMLAEQVLQNARLSDDQILMIRTVVGKPLTVDAVCEEMVAQHASLHQKEKRTQPHFPRGKGPGYNKGGYRSGKGKGYGYLAEFEEAEDYDEAYVAWDNQSQSLADYDEEGYAYQAAPDLDYVDEAEGVVQAFTAMLQEGFDETLDGEAAEFAAEVLQSEGEAYMLRQQERKARISSLKERTTCKRCGQKGHWANDASCPKGKGKRSSKGAPTTSSASSTASTAASKGKNKGKGGPNKPRPVYFAISEPDHATKTAMMATRDDFTKVPPPTSLDPPRPAAALAPTSLDGVAPPSTLSSLLSWPGRRPEASSDRVQRREGEAEQATAPGTFETALAAPSSSGTERATAPRTFETALVAPSSSSSAMVAVAPDHPVNMKLVEGLDMDQQMLIEALRANSDVVLDQMIEAARAMDVTGGEGQLLITQGPMESVPASLPVGSIPTDDAESLSMASPSESWLEAGLEGLEEQGRELGQVVAEESPYPKETQMAEGIRGRNAGQCLRARFTTKGTNKHYYLKT
ncbi:unnamed protein product, partial [Symbiodinium sp. KB8]